MVSKFIVIISFCLFGLSTLFVNGQNLIPNSSFENRRNIFYSKRLFLLSNWHSPNDAIPWLIRREKNWFGNQNAYAGKNYVLIEYGHVKYESIEYSLFGCVQVKLKTKLDSGELYCVEFYSSLADKYCYTVPNLQIGFSSKKINQKESSLAINPDILFQAANNSHTFNDMQIWTKNCVTFKSIGTEKFIQIGFLNKNVNLTKIPLKSDLVTQVGYFIDEVSLKKVSDSSSCVCQSFLKNELNMDSVQSIMGSEIEKPFNLNSIYFGIDSFALSPLAKLEILNIASFLNQNQNVSIQVLGHTDSTGSQKHNIELAEMRAQAVINELIYMGIQPNRLHLIIMESKQPIGDNSTKEGRELNRRVSFIEQL